MKRDVTFPNAQGHQLAGALDLPPGRIRAVALFAHCFTCTAQSHAARRVSLALAEQGIATLRFDFTGLGASEGAFADSHFSANVDDLVAAAEFLAGDVGAPAILIGHSLGGAAVIAAAERIESARAVVTIAAPFDPRHVLHLIKGADDLEDEPRDVSIGGRPFRIGRAFLASVEGQDQADRLARFSNFVAGTDLPNVNATVASEQGQSLVALIAFAADLAREARQTTDVRALVIERGAVVDRALSSLSVQVTTWGRGAARNADDLYGNALFRTYIRNRESLSSDQRELLAARVFAAREAAKDGPARAVLVADAIDLAAKAQAGLRDALAGRLTPAQRRAAARLNIDRMTRALGLIASLATPA